MANLMDGLLDEMNRVRAIIKEYELPELNGVGFLAASIMKADIRIAEQSIKNNDVVQMLQAYSKLKEYEN